MVDDCSSKEATALARIAGLLGLPPEGEVWLGDDAAVLAGTGGDRLLISSDALVDGVHFDRSLVSLADAGWKALAVNVSDMAAMGARPLHAVVTVVGAALEDVAQLYEGLAEAAEAYGCPVVGGDLSDGPGLVISVAVTGSCGPAAPVLRSGAAPGDAIYVTGPLGRSEAGRRLLSGACRRSPSTEDRDCELELAHRRPLARVDEGRVARELGATSMIDLSDGLGIDLDRVATASGIGVVLDHVPVAPGATLAEALGGGEDYELLFSFPPATAVPAGFGSAGLRPPVLIGRCVRDTSLRRLGEEDLPAAGFKHRL